VILLYNSIVPISVVVLLDDDRLMIAIAIAVVVAVVVRADCYANRPNLFGSGRERTCANTRGNSDYQRIPTNHGTSPSM
jgi:hypothetical protein